MFQVQFTENFLTISLENTASSFGRKVVQHCRTKLWASLKQCLLWVVENVRNNDSHSPEHKKQTYSGWILNMKIPQGLHLASWKETQILLHQPSSWLPLLVLLRNSHFPGHPAQWGDMSHLAPTGSLLSWQEPCTTQQGNAVFVLACLYLTEFSFVLELRIEKNVRAGWNQEDEAAPVLEWEQPFKDDSHTRRLQCWLCPNRVIMLSPSDSKFLFDTF